MSTSIIGVSNSTAIDYLFSSTYNTSTQYKSLAVTSLSKGIDLYNDQDYTGAATAFKRATIFLKMSSSDSSDSSDSEYTVDAYNYLGKAYVQLGKTSEAIKNYQEAIRADSTEASFHLNLGDIYYKNGKIEDAQAEYKKAVQLDPTSAENRYSLALCYLTAGKLTEAKEQFTKTIQLAPTSAMGYLGLGQVYRQSKDYNDALIQLNKSIKMDKTANNANAYLELGYTYMDMGNTDMAQKQVDILEGLGSTTEASTLQTYITQNTNPKLTVAYSTDGFSSLSGPGTAVSDLDSSLASVNAAKDFSMTFLFSKAMDSNSVTSLANWQIGRQNGDLISDEYNFGMSIPSTEITLLTHPIKVIYNPQDKTATVTFQITQNSFADGTIDPSHISFRFTGIDTYGKAMDPKADEYSGFSTIC